MNFPRKIPSRLFVIRFLSIALIALVVTSLTRDVYAQLNDRVLNVNTGLWYPSIQSAISSPDTLDGHTLNLITGIYYESVVITKSLIITGTATSLTFIDGSNLGRVISVAPLATVSLIDITVQNGTIYGESGGGIFNQGTLTLTNTDIISNFAYHDGQSPLGGGIYNTGTLNVVGGRFSGNGAISDYGNAGMGIANRGILTLTNSTVSNNLTNISPASAAGVYNVGEATIISTTLAHNKSVGIWNELGGTMIISDSMISGNTGGYGIQADASVGGIYNGALMTITGSLLQVNRAGLVGAVDYREAGGIFNSSTLTILKSTISNNVSCSTGGGLYNKGTVSILESTLSGNRRMCYTATGGAGIANDGTLTMTNSTLGQNESDYGGGLLIHSGAASLNNVTIAYNKAEIEGGGIFLQAGILELQNTLVAQNNSAQSPNCSGEVASLGHNLIGDDTGCAFAQTASDIVGSSDHPINASLGPLGNYGGPNFTVGLIPGSPAIGAGNPATCQSIDQRGFLRQGVCDIGAYEFGSGPAVLLVWLSLIRR